MKKKEKVEKLTLHRETLRALTEETLKEVGTSSDVLMALDFLRRTLAQREVSAQYVLRLANVVRRDQREA